MNAGTIYSLLQCIADVKLFGNKVSGGDDDDDEDDDDDDDTFVEKLIPRPGGSYRRDIAVKNTINICCN